MNQEITNNPLVLFREGHINNVFAKLDVANIRQKYIKNEIPPPELLKDLPTEKYHMVSGKASAQGRGGEHLEA